MIIGVGTDIVENKRITNKIAAKLLTPTEFEIYEKKNEQLKLEFLAGRFASKEAIIKATNKKYIFSEIEILNDEDGKPYCTTIPNIELSISHEKNYSIAFAVNYQK